MMKMLLATAVTGLLARARVRNHCGVVRTDRFPVVFGHAGFALATRRNGEAESGKTF